MISTSLSGKQIASGHSSLHRNESVVSKTVPGATNLSSVPSTLADVLRHVDPESQRRWKRTFTLIQEFRGQPASEILLSDLFSRQTLNAFRPFLRQMAYLENTIVHHRKGLTYLLRLATSLGVSTLPKFPAAWQAVFSLARDKHCLGVAEHFAASYASPALVTPALVTEWAHDQVTRNMKNQPGARKAKAVFLAVLRACGYIEHQKVASARESDYATRREDLPVQLGADLDCLELHVRKGGKNTDPWSRNWKSYEPSVAKRFRGLRQSTADRVISDICRMYGFLRDVCHDDAGIDNLSSLMNLQIFCCYADWLEKVRRMSGGSMRTMFGMMFSTLRHFPKTKDLDWSWTTDFISSLPVTSREERNERKLIRTVPYAVLETVPDLIRRYRNVEIAHHKRAEEAERKRTLNVGTMAKQADIKIAKVRESRLVRIAALAQQELIVRFLLALAWRNENLRKCRINWVDGKPPNLFKGEVRQGIQLPSWTEEILAHDPTAQVWQFSFDREETKAGRAVRAVLVQSLIPCIEEFLTYYRPILVRENDPGALFLNQAGRPMSAQQLEEAVEEATLRHTGKSVNPHLFRDIYALEYLKEHEGNYLELSKILWHKNPEITVMTYSWMFDESIGTNIAGDWSEKRKKQQMSSRKQTTINRALIRSQATSTVHSWPPRGESKPVQNIGM